MAEQDINIIIKMKDELSGALEKAAASMNNFGSNLDQAGRHAQQLGSKLAMVGGVITGGFIAAIKTAENVSIPAYESMQSFEATLRQLQITIVEAALPALQQITNIVQSITNAFNSLDPNVRNTVIQWTFLGGALLLAAGSFIKIGGALTSAIGKIIEFAANLNVVSLTIIAIVAGTALMIMMWDKVRGFAMPVITGLQIGLDLVAIVIYKIIDAFAVLYQIFVDSFSNLLQLLTTVGEKMGIISSAVAEDWRSSLDGMKEPVQSFRDYVNNNINTLTDDMANAMSNTSGNWATNFDAMATNAQNFIQTLISAFQTGFSQINNSTLVFQQHFQQGFVQAFNTAMDIGGKSWKILYDQTQMFSQKFGESFAAMIMHGKNFGESIKQMALDMAEAFIAAVARMIAEWMAFVALKAAFAFLGFHTGGMVMHSGGPVKKAHSGMSLNSDEVPIIAQTGEGILSRSGMRALGGPDVLAALNAGKGAGRSVLINIEINNPVVREEADINTLAQEISRIFNNEIERLR